MTRASPSRAGCAPSRCGRARSRAARSRTMRTPTCCRSSRASNGQPAGPGRFMEWAVGKEGELMRPNSGKLLLPGSRIAWDIHYSASQGGHHRLRRDGHLLLPEGTGAEVPAAPAPHGEHRRRRHRPPAEQRSRRPRASIRCARRRAIESFQPHMHLRGKAMSLEAILPSGPDRDPEPRRQLHVQLAQRLRLRRSRGAAAAEGHGAEGHGVARQHRGQQEQSRIRTSGSATAIARWTRWATRG